MFSRHNEREETANNIPPAILESIKTLIVDSFQEGLKKQGLTLDVFGELYDNEIVLIFSLEKGTESNVKTISLFISKDIETTEKLEKTVDHLVSSSSDFFEMITEKSAEDLFEIYSPRWQKSELENQNFYYKISRENINLTIEANKLLGDI